MIDCLRTRVRKQSIIALYFEFENELKYYNLEVSVTEEASRQTGKRLFSWTVLEIPSVDGEGVGCPDNFVCFLSSTYFTEGRTNLHREAIGPDTLPNPLPLWIRPWFSSFLPLRNHRYSHYGTPSSDKRCVTLQVHSLQQI